MLFDRFLSRSINDNVLPCLLIKTSAKRDYFLLSCLWPFFFHRSRRSTSLRGKWLNTNKVATYFINMPRLQRVSKKAPIKVLICYASGGKSLKPCRSLSLCNTIKAPTTLHCLLAHRKMTSLCTANGSRCFRKGPEKTKSMSVLFLLKQFAKWQYIFTHVSYSLVVFTLSCKPYGTPGCEILDPPTVVVAPQ